ncbi:MAG: hypothetical protein LBJ20_04970, partial [Candidatus Methanoplasma sp.]|nr:hypothetical protein [Candidatus Methanoplasma sp.]
QGHIYNASVLYIAYMRYLKKYQDSVRLQGRITTNRRFRFEKISVYAYENGTELKKENYTVYVERKDSLSTIDVFIPMESDV